MLWFVIVFFCKNSCVKYSDLYKVSDFVKKAKFVIFHVEYFSIRLQNYIEFSHSTIIWIVIVFKISLHESICDRFDSLCLPLSVFLSLSNEKKINQKEIFVFFILELKNNLSTFSLIWWRINIAKRRQVAKSHPK